MSIFGPFETFLSSQFYPALKTVKVNNQNHKCLETFWGDIQFAYPKLIVPFSLTDSYTRIFRDKPKVLPAIIDTGFTRTLAINIDHINARGILKNKLIPLHSQPDSQGREYIEFSVHIWMYRSQYVYPGEIENPSPKLLGETKTVHVFLNDPNQKSVWPPLPLIGLECLMGNNLSLNVDGRSKRFTISCPRAS